MIDASDYQLAWQAYLGCGVLATVLWFFMLRRVPGFFLRYWLLFAAVAFFFTPIRHPEVAQLWVPASVASILALVTEGLESAMPILIILVAGQILAVILAGSLTFWVGKPATGNSDKPAQASKPTAKHAGAPRREPTLNIEEQQS